MISARLNKITSTFIAVISTAIAVIALIVSINESKYNKEHNALSVRPAILIDSDTFNISVRNGGLGPAFIDSLTLETKTGSLFGLNQMDAWDNLFKTINNKIPARDYDLSITKIDGIIEANGRYNILEIKSPLQDRSIETLLDTIIYSVDINIYYHSSYGEIFHLEWRDGINKINN